MPSDLFTKQFQPQANGWERLQQEISDIEAADHWEQQAWQKLCLVLFLTFVGFHLSKQLEQNSELPETPKVKLSGHIAKEVNQQNKKVRYFVATP